MSKIDYVMGFLTADGCVSKDRHGNACSLILELSDKQIVEDIAKEFGKQHYHRSRIIANKERHFYRVTLNHKDLPCDANCFKKGRVGIKAVMTLVKINTTLSVDYLMEMVAWRNVQVTRDVCF